jgi:hypothetical protein
MVDNQTMWNDIRDVLSGTRGAARYWRRLQARRGLRWIRDVLWAGAPAAYSAELHRHDEPKVRWPQPQPLGEWLTLQQVLDLVDEPFERDRRRREHIDRWLDTQFSLPADPTHITGTRRPGTDGNGNVFLDELHLAVDGPEHDLFHIDKTQYNYDTGEPSNG